MTDIRKLINLIENNLNEAVPLSKAKRYVGLSKNYNVNEYDKLFARFAKYGRGKTNPQRLYFPLTAQTQDPQSGDSFKNRLESYLIRTRRNELNPRSYDNGESSEKREEMFAIPQVAATVKKLAEIEYNIPNDLYKKGLIQIGKRQVKIGKLFEDIMKSLSVMADYIEKQPEDSRFSQWQTNEGLVASLRMDARVAKEYYMEYQNDPARAATKASGYYVVISRAALDIAGMSTDRGWTSCTNLLKGSQRSYVKAYVVNGNMIAYLIKEGDWNIQKPTSRQLICRYNDTSGSDYIFWPQESAYGANSKAFDRFVEVFCKWINRGKDDGVYEVEEDQQYIGQAHKDSNDVNLRNEYNNNRHNPNDPDDEDYDPDDEEYYDEDEDDNEPEVEEPDYMYLRSEYNRHGVTDQTIRLLDSTYDDLQSYNRSIGYNREFPMFAISDDHATVKVDNNRNLETFTARNTINDSIVHSIFGLHEMKGDYSDLELTGKIVPENILTDRDLYDVIDQLPIPSYKKLMQQLNVPVVDHKDDNYHKALKQAVRNLKENDEMWSELLEKVVSSKIDGRFADFIKNRLREYVEYGWVFEDERIKVKLADDSSIDSKVITYFDIDDAFDIVMNEDVNNVRQVLDDVNREEMRERRFAQPKTQYAFLPKTNDQDSLFGDKAKEHIDGYVLADFTDDGTFLDDLSIKAYLESVQLDTRNLSRALDDIINKKSLAH